MIVQDFKVIVIGGGHAGCEAALASARIGCKTLLVTQSINHLGCMPCNPSIGGLAKSHLVFELDALGGEMAKNADYTGLEYRILNTSRGPAVRANRVQCDKIEYSRRMRHVICNCANLTLLEDECIGISVKDSRISSIFCAKTGEIHAEAVVITSGTALNGVTYIGKEVTLGGGDGRPTASMLSKSLRENGFELIRLKTGTPPRLYVNSIDFSKTEHQYSDFPLPLFSYRGSKCSTWNNLEHKICSTWNNLPSIEKKERCEYLEDFRPWEPLGKYDMAVSLSHTTEESDRIVKDHLLESALYGGAIKGTGVRYCPSFEDKVVKFGKMEHHVILEPESIHSPSVYPNGLSNSLPRVVQDELIHSVPGLEKATFLAYGYAIEYDSIDSRELNGALMSKRIRGLFFAGQTNGTTGYEEAAAQGIIAGINATMLVKEQEFLILSRNEAYIGVMIDDLITKGTDEPYRMFTSRAERRLLLRQDNARFRLLKHAKRIGLASEDFISDTQILNDEIEAEKERIDSHVEWIKQLSRPGVKYENMSFAKPSLSPIVIEQLEIWYKYRGYLAREDELVTKMEKDLGTTIPDGIDYFSISALRYESREKLTRIAPTTLLQASRIPGINPADISVLSIYLHSLRK